MTIKQPEEFLLDRLKTPIGELLLAVDQKGRLRAADFEDHEDRMVRLLRRQYGNSATIESGTARTEAGLALEAYFSGDLAALDRIECKSAGTAFQESVWTALRTIPAGETLSYGILAVKIGSPRAVRAVGLANGSNPIPVVVPCHRVIGSDGSLTGYGGGLDRKLWLLRHEGASFRESKPAASARNSTVAEEQESLFIVR